MAAEPFNVQAFNADVKGWGKGSLDQLKGSLSAMGVRATGQLLAELRVRTYQRFGQARSVGFQFPRYAVFVEKGAGRGYGGRKGSQWRTRGQLRKTHPDSLGKMGTGSRPARAWANPVIDRRVPVLADLVLKHYAGAAINSIRIR